MKTVRVFRQIGASLAAAGININDVRNPHDSKGKCSLAILKISPAADDAVVQKIAADIQANIAFHIEL